MLYRLKAHIFSHLNISEKQDASYNEGISESMEGGIKSASHAFFYFNPLTTWQRLYYLYLPFSDEETEASGGYSLIQGHSTEPISAGGKIVTRVTDCRWQ